MKRARTASEEQKTKRCVGKPKLLEALNAIVPFVPYFVGMICAKNLCAPRGGTQLIKGANSVKIIQKLFTFTY